MKDRDNFRTARIAYIFTNWLIIAAALFFVPVLPDFEPTKENYFTVELNGEHVGVCGDPQEVETLIVQARREIARKSEDMVYIPVDMQVQGKTVLFGQVDTARTMKENITRILEKNVMQTLKPAYTVKVNAYTVNLGSSRDVRALLSAALEKYDTKREYQVELVIDPERELNVLTPLVTPRKQAVYAERTVGAGSGIEAFFDELFREVEPDVEKSDFSNLDYGLVDIAFGDVVEVVEAFLMESEISTLEDAVAEVTADQEKEEIYEVKPGDTLSQIAEDQGLPMEELIAINPTLESETSMIRAGDELIITIPEPELSVVHSQRLYMEDSYDAKTVYIENDSWYTNESVVRQQPSAGFRKAASVVTYRNDREISQEVVKEEVLVEAVPKTVERGTKIPPTFIKPISGGRVSSSYGRRKAPTKGASTNHAGIDWATPTGTAVMASSGGTVTRAGWGSGYGYVVYIRHEGGRETRYGHLSKVLVSPGQQVKQGQKIALSGNTGRSTGPHLHFELRVNGSPVNPLSYFH